jgi:hypothetical protein
MLSAISLARTSSRVPLDLSRTMRLTGPRRPRGTCRCPASTRDRGRVLHVQAFETGASPVVDPPGWGAKHRPTAPAIGQPQERLAPGKNCRPGPVR